MKHTPTPWRALKYKAIDTYYLESCKEEEVEEIAFALSKEDAERIVACVNAFEGVDDIDLKEIGRLISERNEFAQRIGILLGKIGKLKIECEESLKALEGIVNATTAEFADIHGFAIERNQVCRVYSMLKYGTPNAGGGQ